MSKIIDQPVLVEVDRSCAEREVPKKFFWFKRWVKVKEIMDTWKEVGRWWDNDQEKTFFRVVSAEGGIYEVYSLKKSWSLYKVYD